MPVQPPFLYDPVKQDTSRPFNDFDPKSVTRAAQAPKWRKPKPDGPLVSFNQHPDSYLILPYGNINAKPMNPSVKKWVKWLRIVQLILRCFELLCAIGLLVLMILLKGVDATAAWIMRIVPGIAILHTVYGIYHLGRKPSGRTPASSASYMLFASFFDVSIVPFYAFSALVADTKESGWSTLLSNQALTSIFSKVVFYLAAVGGGLHLVSLVISLYLAVTFRKITKLPPDMNPLEDNLTSRHKRNKSSISTTTTGSEKRISAPLESKRSSATTYEDLSRPPTIPFLHTRTLSTDSFSTYRSTPPQSRDGRLDLPSRQYQISSPRSSPRPSAAADAVKRNSGYGVPTPKRTSTPLRQLLNALFKENGKYARSMVHGGLPTPRSSRASSPKKAAYAPLHQAHESSENISFALPNPLEANPPTPRHQQFPRDSPLAEISNNRASTDIADSGSRFRESMPQRENFKAKYYGELKPGTPPVMVGNNRQVSSGTDFVNKGGYKVDRREVSGKIAEEGRGGGWGTRFRKISGLGSHS
ncbi:hypothetical protein D0Z07_4098 [Hyphodiscus hymeniophilus]|uniref:Uncharacterized protein n=1 Tax=Hyphodiscus hymeniophilus TaxID=353542 RepID=A0A9P6VKQ6_9HELO|nr:hypothetical protein D0Z07_4098 [Hyphodiscus hymeniophilus]